MVDGKALTVGTVTDGVHAEIGKVDATRRTGPGPMIWLAGDPEDLKMWMDRGVYGIVTNTVVLNDMVKKYGQVTEVVQRYLDITDKPLVVEIDGHSKEEFLNVGRVFTEMSDQVILKIPCTSMGLDVFNALKAEGVTTYCTTVFSLTQAAAVAAAGADHILPFCEPVKQVGGDPTLLVRECVRMFKGWEQRPYITAALIRTPETGYVALRDGADGIITFWNVYEEMMDHPLTEIWNKTFMDAWVEMYDDGKLEGLPVELGH